MSRTDLDPATLAASLRRMAGDSYDSEGGIEWVYEPIQARVLLDIADLLDENAKLRERVSELDELLPENGRWFSAETVETYVAENAKLRELCARALLVIENNCSECAYFYECDITKDCKCVAPKKIREELRELGIGT